MAMSNLVALAKLPATVENVTVSVPAPAPAPARRPDWEQEIELVRQIAGALVRRLPSHVDMDELISVGHLGLMEARQRFDASRGVPFAAFAALRVRGAMLDALRSEDLVSRDERARLRKDGALQPTATRVELNDEIDAASDGLDPDDAAIRNDGIVRMRAALTCLSEREREVIEQHYFQEQPLKAVAERLGVTESRVCQIAGEAVLKLRARMNGKRRSK